MKFRDAVVSVFRSFMPSTVSGDRRCTVSDSDCLLGSERQPRSAEEIRVWDTVIVEGVEQVLSGWRKAACSRATPVDILPHLQSPTCWLLF